MGYLTWPSIQLIIHSAPRDRTNCDFASVVVVGNDGDVGVVALIWCCCFLHLCKHIKCT